LRRIPQFTAWRRKPYGPSLNCGARRKLLEVP